MNGFFKLTIVAGLLTGFAGGQPAPEGPARNKSVVRRFFEMQSIGDVRRAVDEVAPDALDDGRPIEGGLQRVYESEIQDLRRTFPDWRAEIVDMVAERDIVVALCRVTGTHQGVGKLPLYGGLLVGYEPTGKKFDVAQTYWFTLKNGKLADRRVTRDDVGMYKQLGILPNGVVSETSQRLAAGTRISSVAGSHPDRAQMDANKAVVLRFMYMSKPLAGGNSSGISDPRIAAAREDIFRTFPDWRFDVLDVVTEGGAVVILTRASGTHRGVQRFPLNGALMVGAEPTGKHFEALHIHWHEVRDGKSVQDDRTRDDIGMTRQVGLLPSVK